MTNTKLLKEVISIKGLKLGYIANVLGISRHSLHKKIENNTEFKASEIKKLSIILSLTAEQQEHIFFCSM